MPSQSRTLWNRSETDQTFTWPRINEAFKKYQTCTLKTCPGKTKTIKTKREFIHSSKTQLNIMSVECIRRVPDQMKSQIKDSSFRLIRYKGWPVAIGIWKARQLVRILSGIKRRAYLNEPLKVETNNASSRRTERIRYRIKEHYKTLKVEPCPVLTHTKRRIKTEILISSK